MTEKQECYQFLFKTATLVSTQDYFLSLDQVQTVSHMGFDKSQRGRRSQSNSYLLNFARSL